MINRTQRISLGVASAAAAFLVVTLFLPWMGFTHGGDITQSSSSFVSEGGIQRPFTDQTAFDLSGVLAGVVVLLAVAVLLLALWVWLGMGLIEQRTAGLAVAGLGVALVAAAMLVFGVQSDPLDLGGGTPDTVLLDWGALVGAKLAAVAGVVIILAGGTFLAGASGAAQLPDSASSSIA